MQLVRKNSNEPMEVHEYQQIKYLTFPLLNKV